MRLVDSNLFTFPRCLVITLLMLSCAVAALAEDGVPPLCTDAEWIEDIKTQYTGLEGYGENLELIDFSDVKEIHYGPTPAAIKEYASATDHGVNSRYCSAHLTLQGGVEETLYWRMDYLISGDHFYINYDHCSSRHYTIDKRCTDYVEGR